MSAPARMGERVRMRRPGVPGPRGGGMYLPEMQRTRLLDAAFAIVAEQGFKRLTVRRVTGLAGMSSKTFYDLFADPEDCFLATFDQALEEFAAVVVPAYEGEKEWVARIRAGLAALLGFLDREPALRRIVFVEALSAGPRVLARRAEVLAVFQGAVDEGRAGNKARPGRAGHLLPPLTAEGVVGAAFGLIHARLIQPRPEPLTALLNPLMATIVLPYRGRAAAARELARAAPEPVVPAASPSRRAVGSLASDFRPTFRTHLVLTAVAERPGANNREVARAAGVSDQGQISRLMSRLETAGLLVNTGGDTQGFPRAWRLTPRGEQILHASRPLSTSVPTTKETR